MYIIKLAIQNNSIARSTQCTIFGTRLFVYCLQIGEKIMELKNIITLSKNDLLELGNDIIKISEENIVLWASAHKDDYKEVMDLYKKSRIRENIIQKYDSLFNIGNTISHRKLSTELNIDAVSTCAIINRLVDYEYIVEKGSIRTVANHNKDILIDTVSNIIWENSPLNIDCFIKSIRDNTIKLINSILINDIDFLDEINTIFRHYNPSLLNKSREEKREFFITTIHNTSRGYLLSIIVMKHLYKKLVDNANLYTDEYWTQKIKRDFAFSENNCNDYKSYSAYMKFIKEETSELIRIFPAIFMDGTFGLTRIMMFFNFGFPRANIFREQLCETGLLTKNGEYISPLPAESIYTIPLATGLITEVFSDKMLEKVFGDDSSSIQIILQNQKMVEELLEKYIIDFNHVFRDLLTIELKNGTFIIKCEDSFKYGHDSYPNDFELCHVISSCLQIMAVKAFYSIINQKSETVRFNPLFVIQTELNSGLQIKYSDRIAIFADAVNIDVYTFYKKNCFKKFTKNEGSL